MKRFLCPIDVNLIRSITVFLFCLLLPAGWAKHWIVPNSLVNGVLVDYLMPDVWIQDLLALAIIVLSVPWLRVDELRVKYFSKTQPVTRNPITLKLFSIILVLISLVLSPISLISTINFARFLLAMSVGWLVYKNKNLRRPASAGLAGAVIWTGFLTIGQFINQATFIGWQFFGEPIFTSGTGGIKKIFIFGQELIAPMATFPHANVMGAFGLLTFLVLIRHFEEGNDKEFLDGGLHLIAKYLSLILIVLSFSLPVWLITSFLLIRKFKSVYVSIPLSVFLGVIVLRVMGYVLAPHRMVLGLPITSFYRRLNLTKHALTIIKDHPFSGVGWGGFVRYLPPSTFLQPVHNVYLLVLAELGIIGASGLVLVVGGYLKNLDLKKYLLIFTVYLLLFLVDHYFWTTTQGIYMLWVIISLL